MQTRQDIFQKRVETGKAEYEGTSLEEYVNIDDNGSLILRYYSEIDDEFYAYIVSVNDILFGPSNFFEIMFGEKVIDASEHCPREPRQCCCGHGLTETEYHKIQCIIAKDKLQYLLDAVPTK